MKTKGKKGKFRIFKEIQVGIMLQEAHNSVPKNIWAKINFLSGILAQDQISSYKF